MKDTDEDETQRGLRFWLPPSRGAGRGRGLLIATQWSPGNTEVALAGRTTLADTVPTGYGRPRGDAGACPVDETVTFRPPASGPAGRCGGRGWSVGYRWRLGSKGPPIGNGPSLVQLSRDR